MQSISGYVPWQFHMQRRCVVNHIPTSTPARGCCTLHTLFCALAVPVKERAADTPTALDVIGAANLDAI